MFPSTNLKRQEDIQTLSAFFGAQADGDYLPWFKIETDTGIKMDLRGKNLARTALRKIKRPYLTVKGEGVRLSAPDNAIEIMGERFKRIDGSVRRADRTRSHLSDRHMHELDEGAAHTMETLGRFFGTIRAVAKSADQVVYGRLRMHAERGVKKVGESKKPPGV